MKRISAKRLFSLTTVLAVLVSPANAGDCRIASIMYGGISFDVLPHFNEAGTLDYESAIIRSAVFTNEEKPFGAILGEITVDRGGFAVRTPSQEVVGVVTPDFALEGWDDSCSVTYSVEIVPVKKRIFVILSDRGPLGTIEGRFPKNTFGVPSD